MWCMGTNISLTGHKLQHFDSPRIVHRCSPFRAMLAAVCWNPYSDKWAGTAPQTGIVQVLLCYVALECTYHLTDAGFTVHWSVPTACSLVTAPAQSSKMCLQAHPVQAGDREQYPAHKAQHHSPTHTLAF